MRQGETFPLPYGEPQQTQWGYPDLPHWIRWCNSKQHGNGLGCLRTSQNLVQVPDLGITFCSPLDHPLKCLPPTSSLPSSCPRSFHWPSLANTDSPFLGPTVAWGGRCTSMHMPICSHVSMKVLYSCFMMTMGWRKSMGPFSSPSTCQDCTLAVI